MTIHAPHVTVVLLNWNSGCLGRAAAESVLAQDYPAIDLIVVDNDSSDTSLDQILETAPDASVLRSPDNVGFAAGMNLGIGHATGDYVLPLNCDAELGADYVSELVEVLETHPRVAAGGGLVESDRAGPSGPLTITRTMRTRTLPLEDSITCAKVNGACPLFRAAALDEVTDRFGGPYDESYGTYGEDVDLAHTLGRLGWEYRYEPSAVARHVRSYSSAMRVKDKRGPLRVSTIANRHRNITRHGGRGRLLSNTIAFGEDAAFAVLQFMRGDRQAVADVRDAWSRVLDRRPADARRRKQLP